MAACYDIYCRYDVGLWNGLKQFWRSGSIPGLFQVYSGSILIFIPVAFSALIPAAIPMRTNVVFVWGAGVA